MKALVYQSNLDSEKVLERLKAVTAADDSIESLLSKKAFHGVVEDDKFELYTFLGGVFVTGKFIKRESRTIIKIEVRLRKYWIMIHKIVFYAVTFVSLVTLIELISDKFQHFEFGHVLIPFILVSIYNMPKIAVNQQVKYLSNVFGRYLEVTLVETKASTD